MPASNPFATMSTGVEAASTSSWTSRKADKSRPPERSDHSRGGDICDMEAQPSEGMPLLSLCPIFSF
jgi:hypothetical protein